MMNEIKIGDKIQDFRLRDHKEKEVHLYELKRQESALSFHPLAWTNVCAEQIRSLENRPCVVYQTEHRGVWYKRGPHTIK